MGEPTRDIPQHLIDAEQKYNEAKDQADEAAEANRSAEVEMETEKMKEGGDTEATADMITETALKKWRPKKD